MNYKMFFESKPVEIELGEEMPSLDELHLRLERKIYKILGEHFPKEVEKAGDILIMDTHNVKDWLAVNLTANIIVSEQHALLFILNPLGVLKKYIDAHVEQVKSNPEL